MAISHILSVSMLLQRLLIFTVLAVALHAVSDFMYFNLPFITLYFNRLWSLLLMQLSGYLQ